jgi:hypothetical protein
VKGITNRHSQCLPSPLLHSFSRLFVFGDCRSSRGGKLVLSISEHQFCEGDQQKGWVIFLQSNPVARSYLADHLFPIHTDRS